MGLAWILLGSSLCTTVLLYIEMSHRDTLIATTFTLLVIVLVKQHLCTSWWYPAFFEAWLGATFLLANRVRISEGRDSVPAYATFGPGFLLIALFQILRHFSVKHSNDSAQN